MLDWLHKQCLEPEIIANGLEIMQLRRNTLTMIDSLNFFPFPLSALPKAFGLPGAKGYFPYKFNCAANMDYVGVTPDAW